MENNASAKLTTYIPWITAYGIAAGALYLWGYWSKFNVNILEYIGLLDLATAATFPLLSAIAGLVGGAVLGQLFTSKSPSPGSGAETSVGRFLVRNVKPLLFVYLMIVLVGFSFLGDPDSRALVVPLAIAPLISITLASQTKYLSDVITDPNIRTTAISILPLVICAAFGYGRLAAARIADGTEYLSVDRQALLDLPARYLRQPGDFKYLGRTKDFNFILGPDATLVLLKADSASSLVLSYHTTMRPWPAWK